MTYVSIYVCCAIGFGKKKNLLSGRRKFTTMKHKTISVSLLEELNSCPEGIDWFKNQDQTDSIAVIEKLVNENKLDWANWIIVRVMEYREYVSYAIFAAEQVIDIFEERYPNDKRPRLAIESAKQCLKSNTGNKKAAEATEATAWAARDAAEAAWATAWAAWAAAMAAWATAWAAWAATEATWVTAWAGWAAAESAARDAGDVAYNVMKKKLVENGLRILRQT